MERRRLSTLDTKIAKTFIGVLNDGKGGGGINAGELALGTMPAEARAISGEKPVKHLTVLADGGRAASPAWTGPV